MPKSQDFPKKLVDVPSWLQSQRNNGETLSNEDSIKLSAKISEFIRKSKTTIEDFNKNTADLNTEKRKLLKKIDQHKEAIEKGDAEMAKVKQKFHDVAKEIVESDMSKKISSDFGCASHAYLRPGQQ